MVGGVSKPVELLERARLGGEPEPSEQEPTVVEQLPRHPRQGLRLDLECFW